MAQALSHKPAQNHPLSSPAWKRMILSARHAFRGYFMAGKKWGKVKALISFEIRTFAGTSMGNRT
ncbi:MAG: hypothetical protein RSC06_13665, partial [Clostridia bacterium]